MKEEYFDVVDENDKVIGMASRNECHSNPKLIHRGVFVILVDEKNRILLSKRSMEKDTKSGKWEFPAGHNNVGESYASAAKRELKEEVGISVRLKKIAKIKAASEQETEFDEIFLGKVKSSVKITLDKKEVSETRFISVQTLKNELSENKHNFTSCFSMVLDEYLRYVGKK
ncbi:MAG: NUDIX domain-containing protein [Candidatus Aenigmarchaeota archaeon]|nr:NUDIX domain-containing protein [Candidatus Aenigmarchaeota archaeon]